MGVLGKTKLTTWCNRDCRMCKTSYAMFRGRIKGRIKVGKWKKSHG